jgi:FKBP-type peptidyl-prolyl cis-trans isomerase FkpA
MIRRSVAVLAALSPAILLAAVPARAAVPAAKVAPADVTILPVPLQPVVPAAQRSCSAKTATGLGYSVLRKADGPQPGTTDYSLVSYIGYLAASGQVFDQGVESPLQVNQVIPGFGEALQKMERGAIYRFCIPAVLGYGDKATGPIPANSDLVFQVELVDFKTAAEVDAMRQKAMAAQPAAPAAPAPASKP